jgi:hypothetical protein
VKEPLSDPLVPPNLRLPLNLSDPVAPLPLPVPPVAFVTPWKEIVTAPLSPLEHPCWELDRTTTKVILLAPAEMLPFPPKGSHSEELLFGADPLPATLLDPKREFLPDPAIEEIVTVLLLMSNDALPEKLAEKETVLDWVTAPADPALVAMLTTATTARAPRTLHLVAREGFLTMQLSIRLQAGGC